MRLARSFVLSTLVLGLATTARAEVTAIQSGGTLKLTSDADADTIMMFGYGALGEVLVVVDPAPIAFVGVRNIVINAGPGDDGVSAGGIQIGGSLNVNMGSGNDAFELNDYGFFVTCPAIIGGNLDVKMGGQDGDSVRVAPQAVNTITIGRNCTIRAAADIEFQATDDSSNSGIDDIFIGGNLRIESTNAIDVNGDGYTLELDDVNVGGRTTIKLGSDQDVVAIAHGHFAREFAANLGGGDDFIDFRNLSSKFNAALALNGGAGIDTLDGYSALTTLVAPTNTKFELGP